MRRLHAEPPSWVGRYVGLEFTPRGRDSTGVDCWGLVQLVYREQFGVIIEADRPDPYNQLQADGAMTRQVSSGVWSPVATPALGDIARFCIGARLWHVGVLVSSNSILHAADGSRSCVERIDNGKWHPRLRDYWRYTGPVRVYARRRPLEASADELVFPPGASITDVLASADVADSPYLRVYLGDREILREHWPFVRTRAGQMVTIITMPAGGGGGGKDLVRTAASIALVVGAAAASGPLAGALGFVEGTTGFSIAAGLIGTGLAIGGMLGVTALVPPPKQSLSSSGQGAELTSPTLVGARNEIRRYSSMPTVRGEYRYAPPLAAVPYTETVGDDTYLRLVYLVAENGPVAIDQIRIGDTAIENFEGVELEVRTGRDGEAAPALYPGTIHEETFSALLASGSWVTRTTQAGTQEISIDVTLPSGLVEFDTAGNQLARTVDLEVEYAVSGSGVWQRVNGDGLAAGSPAYYRQLDMLQRTPEVAAGGSGTHTGRIGWSGDGTYTDAKPGYLPADQYAWIAQGWLYAPVAGEYVFSIDGSDACDMHVDWREVASYYESHGPEVTEGTVNATTKAGTPITLTQGWHEIRVRVEHRSGLAGGGAIAALWKKPGDSAFAVIPGANLAMGPAGENAGSIAYQWFDTSDYDSLISITEQRTDQIKRSLTWAVPTGRYDVRVRRTTADATSSRILDLVYLTALRSVTPGSPITIDRVGLIALRIKATDQLNGVVDTLNCRVRQIIPDWDSGTSTWIERATSNPASIFRAALQHHRRRSPVADADLDLAELQAWHEYCDDHGFTFNAVLDTEATLWQRLVDIATAGRATPAYINGRWSVLRDRAQTTPRQHFTPRNSRAFKGRRAFPDVTHGVRVQFRDRDSDYEQTERLVLSDGYQINGYDAWGNSAPGLPAATNLETLELYWCDNPDLAFKVGRYYLACSQLRPEIYELTVDVGHLAVVRGDMVYVTHDVPLWGTRSGRIRNLIFDAGHQLTQLELDEPVTMDLVRTWGIRVHLQDGTSWYRRVVASEIESTTVTLDPAVPPLQTMPRAGDTFGFGPQGQEVRELVIRSIEPDSQLGARLELVDHAPEVHDADVGVIPPWDSGITQEAVWNSAPDDPVIESIRSDDYVMIRDADGSLRQRMLITLRRPSGLKPIPTLAQVRLRPAPQVGDAGGPWTTTPQMPLVGNQISVLEVLAGVTYDVEVRVITALGLASAWVAASHTVAGKNVPPPDVVSFAATRLSDGTRRFTWDLGNEPPDVAGVLIRYGDSGVPWEQLAPLTEGVIEGSSPFDTPLPGRSGWQRYAIKMIDTAGNVSQNALYTEIDLGYPPMADVVLSQDERALGWPGTRQDCFVSTGAVLEVSDPTTWSELGTWDSIQRWNQASLRPQGGLQWSQLGQWSGLGEWGPAIGLPMVYTTQTIDAGIVLTCEPFVYATYDGAATIEVAYSETSNEPTNWTSLSSIAGQTVRGRYFRWRVTLTFTANAPVPTLRELVVMLRAPIITREWNDLDTSAMVAPYRLGPGDVRIPVPVSLYSQVRRVSLSFNGAGVGWTWELLDKDVAVGPRVRLYDTNGQPADAVIDAVVRGL